MSDTNRIKSLVAEITGKDSNMNDGEQLIEFMHNNAPRKIWEMDKETYQKARQLCDADSKYFWNPEPNYPDMPGTLFSIPISIAKDKCFQLRYEFPNGESQIIKTNIEL